MRLLRRPTLNMPPALALRDFQLLVVGQLIRGSGQWIQITVVPLLALELGASALDLGIIAALQFFPVLVLAPLGGGLADQIPRRPALIALHAAIGAQALGLMAVGVVSGDSLSPVFMLSALFGIANGLEMPIRQSVLADVLPRRLLAEGVVLHQAAFNITRVTGPLLAALLMALGGTTSALAVVSAFAWCVVGAVSLMRPITGVHDRVPILRSVIAGAKFTVSERRILLPLAMMAHATVFGMSVQSVLAIFAVEVLAMDASGYSALVACLGVGAVAGSATLTLKPAHASRWRSALVAVTALSAALLCLSLTNAMVPAMAASVVIGAAYATVLSVAGVSVQTVSPDGVRGRVMGQYVGIAHGGMALGGIILGAIAEAMTVQAAIAICGAATLVPVVLQLLAGWRIRVGR